MQKIIDKIAKLLALAESQNEHEAAVAAARAQALMEKHRIDVAMLAQEEETPFEDIAEELFEGGQKKVATWKKVLLNGICKANSCKCFARKGYRTTDRYIVGTASNRATVAYFYKYLCGEIDRLTAKHKGAGRRWITSFRYGAAEMISKRMLESVQEFRTDLRKKNAGNEVGLVKVEKAIARMDEEAKRLNDWVRMNLNLRTRTVGYNPSAAGYAAGAEAGRSIRLGTSGKSLGTAARALGPA